MALSGQGCGDTSDTARQCIRQTACSITLSTGPAGGNCGSATGCALSGTTDIAMDGSFMGAAITEGTGGRTGCTATWDAGSSTLTVDCGGTGTSQSCIAALTRTSQTCP